MSDVAAARDRSAIARATIPQIAAIAGAPIPFTTVARRPTISFGTIATSGFPAIRTATITFTAVSAASIDLASVRAATIHFAAISLVSGPAGLPARSVSSRTFAAATIFTSGSSASRLSTTMILAAAMASAARMSSAAVACGFRFFLVLTRGQRRDRHQRNRQREN